MTPRRLLDRVGRILVAAALAGAGLAVLPPTWAHAAADSVTITVTAVQPATVTPTAEIVVSGTVTNVSEVPIRDLVIRLQRGPVLTTRSALAANDADPSAALESSAPFVELADAIDIGQSVPFTYRTTAEGLGLAASGVYPLLVNVNGTPDGEAELRAGELATVLPFFAEPPAAATAVAWLWPLVDRPHRDVGGVFLDDELADSVAGGGRLDRLLSLVEDAPQVRLTLAVDPLLLEDLLAMVAGYATADGATGGGGVAAASWLGRLRTLGVSHPVLALPYADVDVVALSRAGLGEVAGQALDDGRALVADAVGREPERTLAWPVDGLLTEPALGVFAAAGRSTYVLSPTAVERTPGRTPSTVSTVRAGDDELDALVSDATLDRIVAAADRWPTGPALAVQRFVSELAMITVEAPSQPRELLVVPPRRFDPRATYALPMLATGATEPWLSSTDVDGLDRSQPVARGGLVYPASAGSAELDPAAVNRVQSAARSIEDFQSMLVTESEDERAAAARLTDPLSRLVQSAASSAWRSDVAGLRRWAGLATAAVQAERRRVFLIVPADGRYSLGSANASLVFTVENQLPVPVQVRISVDSTQVAGLTTGGVGAQVLAPGSRTLIEVPATVERPGEFRVTSSIFTPAGGTLGDPVRLTVRSTVYGGVALVITIGAGALLALLIARRAVHRIRHGRPTAPSPTTPLQPVEVGQ